MCLRNIHAGLTRLLVDILITEGGSYLWGIFGVVDMVHITALSITTSIKNYIVDLEIFNGKTFSPVAQVAKIECTEFFPAIHVARNLPCIHM